MEAAAEALAAAKPPRAAGSSEALKVGRNPVPNGTSQTKPLTAVYFLLNDRHKVSCSCHPQLVFLCIQGRWSLLWSSPQSDFARAKRRFGPIPTASVQLIGEAGGIEDDRAANLIQIAGGE